MVTLDTLLAIILNAVLVVLRKATFLVQINFKFSILDVFRKVVYITGLVNEINFNRLA